MLEWITPDPLNGIVITITFFISIIIGRYLRKKRTISCNKGKLMDPRIKILVVFLLIILITRTDHWYLPIMVFAICILISLRLKGFRDYSRKLIFPVILALFIVLTQSLTYGTNKLTNGIIPVYSEGLESGLLIFIRVIAASSLAILLLSNTSQTEIIETMRWYRVPGTILDISSLMSRYIKAFSTEAKKIKQAQESRGGFSQRSGFREKMHDVAAITGALITRAIIRAEMVYRAMVSRGWKNEPGSLAGPLNENEVK